MYSNSSILIFTDLDGTLLNRDNFNRKSICRKKKPIQKASSQTRVGLVNVCEGAISYSIEELRAEYTGIDTLWKNAFPFTWERQSQPYIPNLGENLEETIVCDERQTPVAKGSLSKKYELSIILFFFF